jgi:hypothetical protein
MFLISVYSEQAGFPTAIVVIVLIEAELERVSRL